MPDKPAKADALAVVRAFVAAVQQPGAANTIFIGIDPGASGAIGLLCGRVATAVDIPTIKVDRLRTKKLSEAEQLATGRKTKSSKGSTTKFNYPLIVRLFRILKPVKERLVVALEQGQIQVRGKGANAYNGFRVGVAYGIWPLFLAQKGYDVEEFAPGAWKTRMGLAGKDKEASRAKALGLWPKAPLLRKQDHDRAEALLLAEHCRRTRGGQF